MQPENEERIREKLKHLPEKPGVYLMKDNEGQIIYVGKAVVLKNRVRSYFQSNKNHAPKVRAMVSHIADLEYIVTGGEVEALILECNLIKQHRPKYNISLRDDKTYPYIKLSLQEEFPRLYIARRVVKDGARYFGPYTNAGAVHETIKLLRRLFPLRSCRTLEKRRPCLEYHIKRCLAPCAGLVAIENYRQMVADVTLFLEGRSDALRKDLKSRMAEAAEALEFEKAARYRDQLTAIEQITARHNGVSGEGDQDVIGIAQGAGYSCVQVFFIRSGKLVGRDHFILNGVDDEVAEDVATAFLKQYYSRAAFIPREILLPHLLPEGDVIGEWLSGLRGAKVQLLTPQRGSKRDLLIMAADNAATLLEAERLRQAEKIRRESGALEQLGEALALPEIPKRIECFDISHIQGAETVASMVVFQDGKPHKASYRKFRLAAQDGKPDDFNSMREVVGRRYVPEADDLPDLIIIDGGKGQLSSALEIIRGAGHYRVPVVGLAKEFEHIFREGESEPVILPRESAAMYLVQRIRDEAHRFAITYHRKLRGKRNLVSVLDHIEGIGPKRRQALWQAFKNIAQMRQASVEELAAVPGMNRKAAEEMQRFFKATENDS